MLKGVRTYEPEALVDKLIVGAYIEARSCERFAKISPHLAQKLASFIYPYFAQKQDIIKII